MSKIFKNMAPYWKSVILVLLLLFVQAWCDLSLPAYTSDIIDVGIINSGVEHVIPEAVTAEEYQAAPLFMTDQERELWESCYVKDGKNYRRKTMTKQELDEADEALLLPLLINYQVSAMQNTAQRDQIMKMMAGSNYNPDQSPLEKVRMQAQDTMDTMGDSMVKSMGIAYAVSCDQAAGLDMEKIQFSYLLKEGLKMIGIALILGAAAAAIGFFGSRIGAGIGRDLRRKTFQKVVGFSNAEMDRFSTASLITRSTNDIQQIQMVSAMLIRMAAYAPILGIGGIIKVAKTGAGMGWIIILAVLVILGYVMILMSVTMPKFKLMQKLVDRVNLVSREILTGLSVIRAFGREKKEEERFDDANRELTKTMLFTNRVMTFMMPGMMFIMNLLAVGIVWFGAKRIDVGTMQVGAMTAFITYSMMIVMAFLMLTMMSIMLPRAAVAAERIDEVIRTDSSILEKENPQELAEKKGVIRFSKVSFRYPNAEENVIEDIDFTAKPGETTAIIGSTGSGKSTLVHLIPRLYDVTGGAVLLDGKDIRDLRMEDLRGEIGFVPQKGILFSGTVASNLRFGKEEANDEEIREAARIAQAQEFIEEKTEQYEHVIAQGGSNVSGGQKQRLAIARAIAKDPQIYIFDDSFSALDLKTDAALRRALSGKVADKTVLIVAQRISTILHAEQILVLHEGRIVGKGTHEELLKNCETYREIAKSQLSAKELGMEESEVAEDE